MHEFKIDGPALKPGVPLHIAASALENFQSVVDKSYLALTNAKRMSARDREVFQLRASEFRHGSFQAYFEIAIVGMQIGLPLASTAGLQNLWMYTTQAFEYLKVVCAAVQRGEQPTYQFNTEGDATVTVGDTHHHYHSTVIQIGQMALPSYQALAHLIDAGRIEEVMAGPAGSPQQDIYLGPKDRGAFDVPTRTEKEPVELRCEIYDFNKFKNSGKLAVQQGGQAVPPGDYSFQISGSQDNLDYIYSMVRPEIVVFCLVELEISPFGGEKIHKLHVTGVNAPR